MNRFSLRIRKLSRELGAKPTPDPDGVIAVLQVGRRLIKDNGLPPEEALLQAADLYASPKDPVIAFWTAHYAYASADLSTDSSDPLAVMDKAISNQGLVNQLVKKGPR